MLRSVLLKTIRDQRKALAWWALAFVGTVLMYAAFYPTIRENAAQMNEYVKSLPEAFRNLVGTEFTSPAGYIKSEMFSFLGPILFLVFAVGAGSRAIAGEEEAGTLDLLLSVPIRRRRVLLDKFWAMVGTIFALAATMWAAIAILGPPFDLHLDLGNLTAATLGCFLLAIAFGSIALAVGCATGSKGLATGVPSGIALVTFIVNMLAPSVVALKPFRMLSPFYYYIGNDPLVNGLDVGHAAVLLAISVAAVAVALVAFDRRDLAV